ncbi:MAG: hypothetical protein HYU78_12790, partial [Rhodocyclales bacterium]|nr:hypothetical protein [Rhodocyclales bacterium]
ATNLLANLAGQQGLPKSGSERSQTLAVISPATITLTGGDEASRQAAATLTGRDAATANQALTNTLTLQDAARVERRMQTAQQNAQAANLVGQVAAGMIGDLSTAMRKPINDATLRQELDAKQANGGTLSNVDRYELARLDHEGMTSEQAARTLADPAANANYDNWQEGSANKVILHGLAGVLQARVGNGSVLAGAASGAVNEAVLPATCSSAARCWGPASGRSPTARAVPRWAARWRITRRRITICDTTRSTGSGRSLRPARVLPNANLLKTNGGPLTRSKLPKHSFVWPTEPAVR